MRALDGRRVLLVEDESLVAMLAEDMLLDLGCEVVVAMRLEQALARVAAESFDVAVLDVNLGSVMSYPLADVLLERQVPFLFATGYGLAGPEQDYRGVPVIQKPFQLRHMKDMLSRLLGCGPLMENAVRPHRHAYFDHEHGG